jgi:hypothetical protein
MIAAVAFFALAAAASAKQYVLKHPKREHCKAHYIKKTKTTKKHGHKIKQTVCIYIVSNNFSTESSTSPPSTQNPASEPTKLSPVEETAAPPSKTTEPIKEPPKEEIKKEEPKQIATVTKLEASKPEECSQSFTLGGENETCYFEIFVSVNSVEGEALSTPTPTFTFTNEGDPGMTWSFSSRGITTFWLSVNDEYNAGFGIEETYLAQPHELLAQSHGLKPWEVYASYAGTSKYAASQSGTLSLVLH